MCTLFAGGCVSSFYLIFFFKQKTAAEMAKNTGTRTLGQRAEVGYLAHDLKSEVSLELLSDQSVFIRDAVEDVQSSAVLGSLLTVIVIWLFLRNLVGTVIIGISIPVSLIVAFAPMFLGDVTLNIMSMGGLALGTGMMLDNAIVILESITSRREAGDDRVTAAIRGTSDFTGAMVASPLTSVAVFAPIVFVTGIAGQIFGDQALTVVSFQFISLLMAMLLIPLMTSRLRGSDALERPVAPPGLIQGVSLRHGQATHGVLLVLGRAFLALLGGLVRGIGVVWIAVRWIRSEERRVGKGCR